MSAIPSTPEEARELLKGLRERVDHLFDDVVNLEATAEDHDERIAELEAENEMLRKRLEEIESKAEHALVVASAGHDPESESKKGRALQLTRNELVKHAANNGSPADRPVTVKKVKTMARPEMELAYQTVKDAWDDLTHEWPCFRETTKNGSKAVTVSRGDIPKALARAVEADLGRDDLTKRLISDEGVGGGSE